MEGAGEVDGGGRIGEGMGRERFNSICVSQGSPQNGRVEWCLVERDQRDFEVLLHSLYHIKGKG